MNTNMGLDQYVTKIQDDIHSDIYENFVRDYKPFILSTVSEKLGRYVSSENEDAFSIGLSAFCEAIEKFKISRGHFLGFAKVVINRRLINYLKKEQRFHHEDIQEHQIKDHINLEDQIILKNEIQAFENELFKFNLKFEDLIESKPKHYDTLERSKKVGIQTSRESDLVDHLYVKKRLPVTEMCRRFMMTRKIIYGSKNYIISIIVVFFKKFDLIKKWI